jgi:hypothetical protein
MEMGSAHADIRLILWATLTPPSKPATIALTYRCRSHIVPYGMAVRRYTDESCKPLCILTLPRSPLSEPAGHGPESRRVVRLQSCFVALMLPWLEQ